MTQDSAGSGSAAIRSMLRERIELLLAQWRTALAPWKSDQIVPIVAALSDLSKAAVRFQLEGPALVMRDAAAYLGFLLDTADTPNFVQHGRIVNYLERLTQVSAELANLLAREELERPSVLYVYAPQQEVHGLDEAMRSQSWHLLRADSAASLAAVVKARPLVGVVVDSSLLDQLGEIVTALDQQRKPGPTPPLLVVTREPAIGQVLLGMTGSADAFLVNADAAGVISKLAALQRSLSSAEPLRVLIVDDDRTQVMFCDAVLRRRGLATQVCASSHEALEMVASFRPDLMLVDLYMPDLDGMALTARVREMPGTTLLPIVFISGEQDVSKRVWAINIGADDFLTKPIRPAHLLDVVVGRAKRARALRRQVLGSPADAQTGPFARSVLAARIREMRDRPAALFSLSVVPEAEDAARLPSLLRCEIEHAVSGRIAARLNAGDAFAAWDDLHFLILAARADQLSLEQLAHSLRLGVEIRPLVVSIGQLKMKALVQTHWAVDEPQAWLDASLADGRQVRSAIPPLPRAESATPAVPPPIPVALAERVLPKSDTSACIAEYQPLIPMHGAVGDQWQQRLRWRPASGLPSLVLREEVVSAARQSGNLSQLDRLAVRLALQSIARFKIAGRRVALQVEVDLASLTDPGFLVWLQSECAADLGEDCGLIIEVDTDAVIACLAPTRPLLDRLHTLGIRICLRHFGAQREAPRLLQLLRVGMVKLDAEHALNANSAFTSMLAQIRDSAIPIEVEGVPNRQAIEKLWDLGADYIQCNLLRPFTTELDFDFGALH